MPGASFQDVIRKMAKVCRKREDPLLQNPRHKATPTPKSPRHIPAKISREVWKRDGGRCTHPGCGSHHFVQIDHHSACYGWKTHAGEPQAPLPSSQFDASSRGIWSESLKPPYAQNLLLFCFRFTQAKEECKFAVC